MTTTVTTTTQPTSGPLVVEPFGDAVSAHVPFAVTDARGTVTAYVLREADAELYATAPQMLTWLRRYAPTTCIYDYPAAGPKPKECRCAGCEARAILEAAR